MNHFNQCTVCFWASDCNTYYAKLQCDESLVKAGIMLHTHAAFVQLVILRAGVDYVVMIGWVAILGELLHMLITVVKINISTPRM